PATIALDDLAIATVDSIITPPEAKALLAATLVAQTDVAHLNSAIYVTLAAHANDEALAAAKKLVEQSRQPQFLDTFAECLHVTGDRVQALSIEDEALKAAAGAPLEPTLKRNRARFDTTTDESDEVITLRARVAALW